MANKARKGKEIRIIRTIESFYPYMSGPANQAFMISSELEKRGVRNTILTSDYHAEKSPKHEKMSGVEVYRFPINFRFMKYFYTPSIKDKYSDFDIVCAHSYRSYQTEIGYKMARKYGKPFVLHNHGSLMGYKAFVKGWRKLPYIFYDMLHRKIALDADAVIVNTKQEHDEVLKFGVDRKKVHIIPVGIDAGSYAPGEKNWTELRLLFVGRISRDRNIEPIIKAVKLLDKKIDVKLTIVGEAVKRSSTDKGDYLSELNALAKTLGVDSKVKFVGAKYGEELKLHYKNSDIFVYTSLWENFGQTILEAAAAGLPLVCTPVGVALDLVDEGKTGKIISFQSPNEIAKAVLKFANRDIQREASINLIKHVKKEYSRENIMETYLKIYSELV